MQSRVEQDRGKIGAYVVFVVLFLSGGEVCLGRCVVVWFITGGEVC